MVRNRLLQLAFALLSLPIVAAAQTTHTFTFGPFSNGGAAFQTLDGNPANCGIGYCGSVQFPYNENPWWGLIAPQGPVENTDGSFCTVGGTDVCSWGFPNNGFLTNNNNTPQLSAPTFPDPNCNLKTAGCVDYATGTSVFEGYGQGVTVSVTAWFQVNKHTRFGRGCYPCVWYTNDPTNGSGTASYTP